MCNTLLAEFTARTTRVSNPFCSPSFRSSQSDPFWLGAFAIGSPPGINTFYRYPRNTPNFSRSRVLQCLLHADKLSLPISQKIVKTCYERFRPNKRDCHLGRWCYRGGWHQSYPPLIRQAIYTWQKPNNVKHLGSPYHTFVHRKGYAPAAPRRAGTSISVFLSGLPLSWPVRIFGLVVHYTANYLIRRRPILWHKFKEEIIPDFFPYQVLPSLSRGYSRP